MKKIFFSLAMLAATAFAATAQTSDPNRLLLQDTYGSIITSQIVDRVGQISFATVEGPVAAEITLGEATLESIVVSIVPTENCYYYLYNLIPAATARQLEADPGQASYYLREYMQSPQDYNTYEDVTLGFGQELAPQSEFAVVTLGIDEYGTDCDFRAAYFTTPKKPLVGSPEITYEVVTEALTEFTVEVTANADVAGFACLAGTAGSMQSQYEMFGPMFGFTQFGDMVKSWGFPSEGNCTYTATWTDMAPNTDYEVFIQGWDTAGTYMDCIVLNVKTASMGGTGDAVVEITLGDYKLADWGAEELLPSQFITYTPNSETWRYRIGGVYYAEDYAAAEAEILDYVKSEPPMEMVGWWQFEPVTTDYQCDPGKECVAIAIAQNANGEWGEFTILRFTTPETVAGGEATPAFRAQAKAMKNIATRIKAVPRANKQGIVPIFNKGSRITLK